ncbi:MAG: Na+:solute symporter [Cyclobacteriaceae bacterium]
MKSLLYGLIVLILPFISCGNNTNSKTEVAAELRQDAIDHLQSVLFSDLKWVKVHAAEYLLKLDYRAGVDSVFKSEEEKFGDEPFYRIGIWRVLAQSGGNEDLRQFWIDKISAVYEDSLSQDRIHAAEALAKLEIAPSKEIHTQDQILSIFSTWAHAYASESRKNVSIDDLMKTVKAENQPERARKLAAYALRSIRDISLSDWDQLTHMAVNQTTISDFQVYLTSLSWVAAPSDSISVLRLAQVKDQLLQVMDTDNLIHQRELAYTLAEKGNDNDRKILEEMLESKPEGNFNKNNDLTDLKITAAYAMLRIDRRVETHLSWFDWIVISLYGTLMLGIGYFYSKKNKTKEDYLLGGRNMNAVSIGVSLFATLLSTVSYLSYPGEMIKYGPVIFAGMLGFPFVYFVAGWWLIPRIMAMKVTSAYEILELKLGLSIRMLAIFMFLSLRFLWMATIIYVTVDVAFLSVVPMDSSYVPFISTLLLIITIIYTSMGGLKAVVVTDVVQSIVFLGGALLSILIVSLHFGSFSSWLPSEWPAYWKPIQLGFDTQERTTIGNAVIMLFAWYICTTGSDQLAIQRYLSTKDIQSARKSLKVSLYTNLLAKCLLGLLGLAMFAFFSRNQHFLADGQSFSEQSDTLFPRFILLGLPIGISGLVIAGLLAAAMSSLSSGLNSVSTVISEDIFNRFFKRRIALSFKGSLQQVKMLSYLTGLIVIGLSFFVGSVQGNLFDIVIKVTHLFVAPLFVLFFMALFVPFASERGTFLGGIAAIIVAVGISFYGILGITVLWVLPFSFFTGTAVACVLSFIDKIIKKKA